MNGNPGTLDKKGDGEMKERPLVLVVDDGPEILDLIRRALRMEGVEVETATDPREALGRMRETLHSVAVCDIMMPGMTGVELLQEIKRVNPQTYQVDGAHNWKNGNIDGFLYAAMQYFHPKPLHQPEAVPSWRMFAEFLWCGKIME